jgi:hypothetical protein
LSYFEKKKEKAKTNRSPDEARKTMTSKDQRTMKQTSTLPASWNDLTLLAGWSKILLMDRRTDGRTEEEGIHTYIV